MTTAAIPVILSPEGPRRVPWDVSDLHSDLKVPPPRYRHAAPSAPWPWMDFDQDAANVPALSHDADEPPWGGYPQSHFGNWTPDQVERCRMLTICKDEFACRIHKVNVFSSGKFGEAEEDKQARQITSEDEAAREYWDEVNKLFDPNLRVQALFIENITLNVLKILGARYDIEPFFFASSANWIPSRYQENPLHGKGDHITVVLPFIRTVKYDHRNISPSPSDDTPYPTEKGAAPITDKKQTIDTQAPLVLSEQKILVQDLLAIHMVRNVENNIIISYHHHSELQKTTARRLQTLVQRTGDSVYWSKIYAKAKDPTLVFLAILWYPLYAWDEAFGALYAHLNERLEAARVTTGMEHTRELHKLQAHILHYEQLLQDFRKSVEFVRDTPNPAMFGDLVADFERESSNTLLKQESANLILEIDRLEKQRQVQSDRLKNATKLAFSAVNNEDSKNMQALTKATLRDSASTKLVSYLILIFLPATFLSAVFGMNVVEINPYAPIDTLWTYIESTVILTAITVWGVIAWHDRTMFHPQNATLMQRLGWPVIYGYELLKKAVAALGRRVPARNV